MKITKLVLFFLISCHLYTEELIIQLPTEQETTHNVYLAHIRPIDTDYYKTLNDSLRFDFQHNFQISLLPIDENKQFYAHHVDPQEAFQSVRWKKSGVRYVVVPSIKDSTLTIRIFDVNTASLKTLHPITLTKQVDKDCHAIHQASENIFSMITNDKGIPTKRILYSYQPKLAAEKDGHWHSEIWEMGYDGKNKRQITKENHYCITPVFLSSGTNSQYDFLYVTYKQGPPRIYQSSRDSNRGKPFISLRGNQLLPAVSKNKDRIAFISDASGRADLFIQTLDPKRGPMGKPVQVYSVSGSVQASPTFNPEGTKLAFVSDQSGTPRIYIIDINEVLKNHTTPTPILISKEHKDNSAPSWSPDGSMIAYSAKINGVRQIFIYDTETRKERQVTLGMGNKENPSWGKDSRHLVYNSTSPTFDIFLLDIGNPEPIRLTDGPGMKHYPVFEN